MNPASQLCGLVFSVALALPASVSAQHRDGDTAALIGQIIQIAMDRSLGRARAELREHRGIDPLRRGFEWDRERWDYPPVSERLPDERRSELRRLSAEYDREMDRVERELQREVYQARREFERDVAREHRAGRVRAKRRRLEDKVDRAYARFRERVRTINHRYDERRTYLLAYDGYRNDHEHRHHRRHRDRGHRRARYGDR